VIAVTATGKRDFRALLIESGAWEGVSVSVPGGLSLVGRIFEGASGADALPRCRSPGLHFARGQLEAREQHVKTISCN